MLQLKAAVPWHKTSPWRFSQGSPCLFPSCWPHLCLPPSSISAPLTPTWARPWSQNGRKQIPSVEGWVLADSQQCCRSPSVSEEEEGWEWRLGTAEGERDCLFSCTELFDRLRYNVKPHLKSQCATSESGWVSVWDGLLAATSWAVTWPSAMAPFYCHAVNAIAFSFKAGFTCSLKGCVPIMGWVPLSAGVDLRSLDLCVQASLQLGSCQMQSRILS